MVSGQAEAALRVGAVSPKKEHDMDRLFTLALATAVCLGTTVLLANNRPAARHLPSADAQMAADGAFRDGLYVGRLAAEGGGRCVRRSGAGRTSTIALRSWRATGGGTKTLWPALRRAAKAGWSESGRVGNLAWERTQNARRSPRDLPSAGRAATVRMTPTGWVRNF
jgi:hypothetical protein